MPALDRAVLSPTGCNLVAFSGGPDSLLLLHLLSEELPGTSVKAVHVDHGRDADSRRRADEARRLASALGVECEVRRLPEETSSDGGPEAALRRVRYALLADCMAPGDHVLTGHHADDQAETVLLRMLRGAGPRGLAGMPAIRPLGPGMLGRPLLHWTRAQIEFELGKRNLQPVLDPGNRDPSLDRNYLRHAVLPILATRWPGWREGFNRSARHQRWASARLGLVVQSQLEDLKVRAHSEICLDRKAWQGLGDDDALALLRGWIEEGRRTVPAIEPQREFLQQCRQTASDRQPTLKFAGAAIRAWRDRLWLDDPDPRPQPALRWNPSDSLPVAAGGTLRIEGHGPVPGKAWTIGPPPAGAALRPARNRPRQRVRELLREAGLPPWRRNAVPAIFIDGQLVAIGTRMRDPEFSEALERTGLQLHWQQCPPAMSALLCLPRPHQEAQE